MPKIKNTKKNRKPRFKFDIQKIIRERKAKGLLWHQLENKKKTPEENVVEDKLLPLNAINSPLTIDLLQDSSFSSLTLLSLAIPDLSEYKKSLEITSFPSTKTESCTEKVFETSIMNENGYTEMIHSNNKANWCLNRLLLISIEENELAANIQFNYLMKANWSPTLNVSINTYISYKRYQKYYKCMHTVVHNFLFVFEFYKMDSHIIRVSLTKVLDYITFFFH